MYMRGWSSAPMDRRRYLRTLAIPVAMAGIAGCASSDSGDGTPTGTTTAGPNAEAADHLGTARTCLGDAIDELNRYADKPHPDFENEPVQSHLSECESILDDASEVASTSVGERRIRTLRDLADVLSTAFDAITIGVDAIVALDDGAAAVDRGGEYRPPGPVEEIGVQETLRLYDEMRAELLTANEALRSARSSFGTMAQEMATVGDAFDPLESDLGEHEEIEATRVADALAGLATMAESMRSFSTAFLHYVNATIVSNEQGRVNVNRDAKYVNGVLAKGPDPQTASPSYKLAQQHFQNAEEILSGLETRDVLSGFRPWYATLTCQLPHQIEATGHWHEAQKLLPGNPEAAEREAELGHEAEQRAYNQC